MESEKASLTKPGRKRWGRRISLGLAGLIGGLTLLPGVAWIFIASDFHDFQSKLWFSVPYLIPFGLLLVASVTGLDGRFRASSILIVLALVIAAPLCVYDLANHRAQYQIGANGPYCYVYWWWWTWRDWLAGDMRILYMK